MPETRLSIRLDLINGDRIGPGKIALLEAIQETGSISAAARKVGMSYRRAWLLVEQINAALPKGVQNTGEAREAGFTSFTLAGRSGQRAKLFLLPDLDQDVSATEIRAALAEGAEQQTVLAPSVAEYIRSHGLYRAARDTIEAADKVGKSKEI